jgi:hypothetical protein
VDGKQNMTLGAATYTVTDFTDDIWIFDVKGDGSAQLIIDFEIEDDKYTALVYDDLNGDGEVRYRLSNDQVFIEESSFWHVKVETDHAWTQPGDLFDADITFWVDGYNGVAMGVVRDAWDQGAGVDGTVDWQVDIGDKNGDGINDYQLQRVISPFLVRLSFARLHKTTILVQLLDRRPTPYANTVFWPLLIGKHNIEEYNYFDHPPAIAVDWDAGIIYLLGILGFPVRRVSYL